MRMTCVVFVSLLAIIVSLLISIAPTAGQEKKEPIVDEERQLNISDDALSRLMQTWEKEVKTQMSKDEKLKALAAKHSLVVLHSRYLYAGGRYRQSAYSFIHESAHKGVHGNNVNIIFDAVDGPEFGCAGRNSLLVDLGAVDFEKNPDLKMITIDHPTLGPGHSRNCAVEGQVYLQRVRDDEGNNFYVLFQIVAVDKDSRYMAFIWRMLPGGKRVVRPVGPGNIS